MIKKFLNEIRNGFNFLEIEDSTNKIYKLSDLAVEKINNGTWTLDNTELIKDFIKPDLNLDINISGMYEPADMNDPGADYDLEYIGYDYDIVLESDKLINKKNAPKKLSYSIQRGLYDNAPDDWRAPARRSGESTQYEMIVTWILDETGNPDELVYEFDYENIEINNLN